MALRDLRMCGGCLVKQREIDRQKKLIVQLKATVARLKAKLGRQDRHIHEKPFGSSTSSSKEPFKARASAENQARKGGAKKGHDGHGRHAVTQMRMLPDLLLPAPRRCPDCGGPLQKPSRRRRRTVSWEPAVPASRTTVSEECWCAHCRKTVRLPNPVALSGMMLENSALATVGCLHYLQGLTVGHIARITGLNKSTLISAMHRLARVLAPAMPGLLEQIRAAAVIFGDETTWRNDGVSGYAWMLRSLDTVVYAFRGSRAGSVPQELLGPMELLGVLVTDRYGGYNGLPISRQYCYAHLLRDLEDLLKDFPDHPEVKAFVDELTPLLKGAMSLRRGERRLRHYRHKARRLRDRIQDVVGRSARHPGVQSFQGIFRENVDRLYLWVEDPMVPAENNTAERGLRPTVIARKLSFGSQSPAGAHTREVIMTVLGTLQMRTHDPWAVLRHALDTLALQPHRAPDIGTILFDEPALMDG
jgi:hypothetical protein